ncbi:hypothetical protein Poli38472_011521 [Pythium oligandrum]|uniref:WW domain-containing protein n=1 Tax=Pythium oligandrum TaxID=41045 RepID=A0A8K1CJ95_PYTOL|nr:hypothetical protein Poli38472_011521 [Pythium oligandrum]|eukprot:TMW64641.1 hypothetical protein Poli38472_011521 [Pythium oligandrum]
MDADSTQDLGNCAVRLGDIAEVVLLDTPANSFRVHTALGRQIVFQYRGEDDQAHQQTRYNASQWCDYLQTLSQYARGNEERIEYPSRQDNSYFHEVSTKSSRRQELLQHMTHAINKNDVFGLKELLGIEQRSNNELRDGDGNSLLGMALKAGANKDIIEALIEARIDCNAQNSEGESPLLLAAASGDLEILRLLLDAENIDINQRCKMGTSVVHAAANAGEAAALQQLCDTGAVLSVADDVGWTAMHYAAVCVSGVGPLRLLCELVPELIDSQCAEGNTALHIAAGYGCEDNVRALLETAANPHILNYDKQTAYHVALHNNHVACAVAIHEYMDTPRDVYEQSAQAPRAVYTEETRSAELSTGRVATSENHAYTFSAWIRATTEDGLEYFYNSITGESTWHRPDELEQNSAQPPPAPTTSQHSYVEEIFSFAEPGQKLPLCMIPLVSPLVSLDDPTAATKLDAQRKKARERRRSKVSKQRQRSHSSDPSSDPVQAVDTTSGYTVS